jgi:hypothetical protein
MEKFKSDFINFTNKIKSGENFAYARYADGEVLLIRGASIGQNSQAYQVDKWNAPNHMTQVGIKLLESLKHTEDNYYYAIASDDINDHNYLMERIFVKKSNITFANLWINSNYQMMKEFYNSFEKSAYVICNENASVNGFPFKVNEIIPFPINCVEYWETYGESYENELKKYVKQFTDQTIFVSAGPVSEILIDVMYKSNPNNQYIDVGSSMDEFVHGRKTRPYMFSDSEYSKEISSFPEKFFYE